MSVGSKPPEEGSELTFEELCCQLQTTEDGLTNEESESRLHRYGPNVLDQSEQSALRQFFHYFWGPIPWMIELAALLSVVIGHWIDFSIVVALLLINGIIGFSEEHKAADALESLKSQLSPQARVLRGGTWQEVDAANLVMGDVVQLRPGDIVPADIYLFDGDYLTTDQSALTGESLPVSKQKDSSAYSGTIVKQGEMAGMVFATGNETYFGRTAELVATSGSASHLQRAVMRIGKFLILIALGLSLLLVLVEFARGFSFLHLLQFILILVVASIPVAMPAVLSVTMALGALALSKQKAIVTRLEAIEELAGIDVLCSDKTGTLTQNKLTLGNQVCFHAEDQQALLRTAALASSQDNGDAIDSAVLEALSQTATVLSEFQQKHFVPFDPVSKRTEATVIEKDGRQFRVTKGAPQVILNLSEISSEERSRAEQVVDQFAMRGYRTLGVAQTDNEDRWKFAGILSLYDPPREDSLATIQAAQHHGIHVKMITGDNEAIARELSEELGMGTRIHAATEIFDKNRRAIDDSTRLIEEADGFSEVFPEHKHWIVKSLQEQGHLVGMTGDGVNDAPALKQAEVGIAVSGATGAAQAAAALVLTKPGLSVIMRAVQEAKRIFERMNSYTVYRIAMTLNIMVFVTLAMLLYNTYPLSAVMIVILALLDDIPIMTIAFDNTFLSEGPVRWNMRRTLSISTVLGALSIVETMALLFIGQEFHVGELQLQTVIFLQLVAGGQLLLLVTRSRGAFWRKPYPSKPLVGAIAGTQTLALLLAGFGWLMLAISWQWIGIVWIYNLIWMFILDAAKRGMNRILAS